MFLSLLKIKADEESENNYLLKREPLYKCLTDLKSDFFNSLVCFYDKKEEIMVAEKELPVIFGKQVLNSSVNQREGLINWGDFGFPSRNKECPEFYNRYFCLLNNNMENHKNAVTTLAYSILVVKYLVENGNFIYVSKKCTYQYLQILKGLINSSVSLKYKNYYSTNQREVSTKINTTTTLNNSNTNNNNVNNANNEIQDSNDLIMKFQNDEFIIILHKNNYWKVIITPNPNDFTTQIDYIINSKLEFTENNAFLGNLTYSPKFDSELSLNLVKLSPNNLKTITKLENCIALIKLNNKKTTDYSQQNLINECWFGNRAYANKIANFTVFKDGFISINLEKGVDRKIPHELSKHFFIVEKFLNCMISNKPFSNLEFDSNYLISMNAFFKDLKLKFSSKSFKKTPKTLAIVLNDELKSFISKDYLVAQNNLRKVNIVFSKEKNDLNKLSFSKSLDPEFYLLIAINAAMYRYTRDLQVAVSEVSTRDFFNGGSELMRVNTKSSNSFALAMSLEYIPRELKIKLGYDAIKELFKLKISTKKGGSLDTRLNVILNSVKEEHYTSNINSISNISNSSYSLNGDTKNRDTNYNNNNKANSTAYTQVNINSNSQDTIEENLENHFGLLSFYNTLTTGLGRKRNSGNSSKSLLKIVNSNKMFNFFNRKFANLNFHAFDENIKYTVSPPYDVRGIGVVCIMKKDFIEFYYCSYNFEKYFLKRFSECLTEILNEMKDLFIQKAQKVKF
jgi:hypothetical protein